VVGEYEDGVPLVVVLDGEANRTKALQEEAAAAEQEQGADRSQAESDDSGGGDDMCESGPLPAKPAKPDHEEQEWGKTVFLNFFPVSKDDPCTGTPPLTR
jgi:hypothetical protein